MDTKELLLAIEAHCRAASLSEVAFGKKAVNNTYWVQRLRTGNVTLSTCARAKRYLEANPIAEKEAEQAAVTAVLNATAAS